MRDERKKIFKLGGMQRKCKPEVNVVCTGSRMLVFGTGRYFFTLLDHR